MTWLKKQGIRCHHSPNGGKRHIAEALAFKAMGVSPGFPDVEIPLPAGPYHGCYIEMKAAGGKLSDYQVDWLNYLREKGYFAECAQGFEEAKAILLHYLSFNSTAA